MIFDKENIILVGSFNTAIIQPDWLKEQNIYTEIIETYLTPQMGRIRYFLKDINIYFDIDQNNIQVSSTKLSENLTKERLKFIIDIFKKLEYTPILAIGYNLSLPASENTKNKLRMAKQEFDNLNMIYFSISRKSVWEDYIMLTNIEKNIDTGLTNINFNFEKKFEKKKISFYITNFLKNLEKMRDYAKNNNL